MAGKFDYSDVLDLVTKLRTEIKMKEENITRCIGQLVYTSKSLSKDVKSLEEKKMNIESEFLNLKCLQETSLKILTEIQDEQDEIEKQVDNCIMKLNEKFLEYVNEYKRKIAVKEEALENQ